MDDLLRQVFVHLRGVWLNRWWGLAAAWICGIGAAIAIMMMPDKFESSARIYVDTQSVLQPLMSGLAIQPNVDQQIAILSRTLISRPNVEKLIRMADLDLATTSKSGHEELIDHLLQTLQIRSAGRDNLYTLAYQDAKPARAQRVVQSLVSIFVESGLGDKRKDTDGARRFIDEQIKNYEQKLEEAENRLKEFKLKNLATFGDNGKDYVGQMAEVSGQLNQARLALREAINSRDALKRQLVGEEPVLLPDTPSLSSISVPEIDGRIESLKKNLDGLLQKYTEEHPDVVGTQRVIAQLEAQKRQEVEARGKTKAGNFGSLNANPVFQQMKIALAESEANVASLEARVAEYEARYNQLKSSSRLLPQIESEFVQLNRDYEVNKRNYESLVARRESASMSVEMESSSGMAEFRLIDPPSIPLKPAAPNRILLMPLAGFAALLAGVAIAFVVSQVRPVVMEGFGLREFTGLPVLGSVTLTPDPARRSRERRLALVFYGMAGSFIGAFAMLTVIVAVLRG